MANLNVQIDNALPRHPKLRRLATVLGVPRTQALGILASLWAAVLELAPDGDLSGWTPDDVADCAMWSDDSARLWEALVLTGWVVLEGEAAHIHDWRDHTGGTLWRRSLARERQRKRRVAERDSSDTMSVTSQPLKQNVTPGQDKDKTRRRTRLGEGLDQGGVGGVRAQRKQPPTFDELLVAHIHGLPAAEYLHQRFPAFDGVNGRPTVQDKLDVLRDWFDRAPPAKRWRTPKGIEVALSRDYESVRRSRDYDARNGQAAPIQHAMTEEQRRAAHEARIAAHQARKQAGGADG